MDNRSTYRLLNGDAKCWWHFVELRAAGKHAEARVKERLNIRNSIDSIRRAALMTIGRGGWSIRCAGSTLSGYGDGEPYATILRRRGVPVIDSRASALSDVARVVISSPIPAIGVEPDLPPYNSLSYAPIEHILELYRAIGADVSTPAPAAEKAA